MGGYPDIPAVLASLRSATQIAKSLITADAAIEKAELKLKMAEIMTQLADAQTYALDVDEVIRQLQDNVTQLEEALRLKSTVAKFGDAYYEFKDQATPTGTPYCLRCWEVDHKLVHLVHGRATRDCPSCTRKYDAHSARTYP